MIDTADFETTDRTLFDDFVSQFLVEDEWGWRSEMRPIHKRVGSRTRAAIEKLPDQHRQASNENQQQKCQRMIREYLEWLDEHPD